MKTDMCCDVTEKEYMAFRNFALNCIAVTCHPTQVRLIDGLRTGKLLCDIFLRSRVTPTTPLADDDGAHANVVTDKNHYSANNITCPTHVAVLALYDTIEDFAEDLSAGDQWCMASQIKSMVSELATSAIEVVRAVTKDAGLLHLQQSVTATPPAH
jgi:hypothetical protein